MSAISCFLTSETAMGHSRSVTVLLMFDISSWTCFICNALNVGETLSETPTSNGWFPTA